MLKRCYLLLMIVFLFGGCAPHRTPKAPLAPMTEPAAARIKQYRQVTDFNQVDIQGRINVNLHSGYKKPQVLLYGDMRDLVQVKTVINNGTLYLALGTGFPRHGEVSVDIRTRFLNQIKYVGAGVVKGTQLSSSYLNVYLNNPGTTELGGYLSLRDLVVKGNGYTRISGISSPYLQIHFQGDPKVQLVGVANIAKLNINGKGSLSVYWVKSDSLKIRAKKAAKIQLAGVVNRLDVELWGVSNFKGRYLRAQRSFVKTHDKSVAEISSVNHQSTLATDASDIFYYNLSTTRADFMAFNGAVLDMRDWNDPYIKDFTTYNHQFP